MQYQTDNLTVLPRNRSMLTMQGQAQELEIREFFSTTLPNLVQSKPAAYSTLTGSICFRIKTLGDWTLELGNVEAPIKPSPEPQADLALSFTALAFSEFIDGTLDIERRLSAGEIAFDGNVQLLEKFGWFMQSTRDLLSIRD